MHTDPAFRGQGFAACALKRAMNKRMAMEIRVFHIDTSDTNAAMRKVLARCGFGDPVARLDRAGKWD